MTTIIEFRNCEFIDLQTEGSKNALNCLLGTILKIKIFIIGGDLAGLKKTSVIIVRHL